MRGLGAGVGAEEGDASTGLHARDHRRSPEITRDRTRFPEIHTTPTREKSTSSHMQPEGVAEGLMQTHAMHCS